MSTSFDSVTLSDDLVPQALPLIRATWPSVDLSSWRNFVQAFTGSAASPGSGVIGLCDQAGCLCGVLAYRPDRDLQAHPILAVHLFTAADLANSSRVVKALLNAAESRALELGCTGVEIRLSSGQTKLASRLRALGLSSDAKLFWKEIDSGQAC
jgi:hypothetical protein